VRSEAVNRTEANFRKKSFAPENMRAILQLGAEMSADEVNLNLNLNFEFEFGV